MATLEALESQTYLPDADLEEIYEFLRRSAAQQCFLSGPTGDDRIEFPEHGYRILGQVVEAMKAGRAVSVMPTTMTLTSQQAADLLGISRPTLVRLVDQGHIPAERLDSRRRLALSDVLDYRSKRRTQQLAALSATEDLDDEDIAEAIIRSKEARAARASRRAERRQH